MDYSVDYALLGQSASKAAGLAADISSTMQEMRVDDVPPAIQGTLSANAATTLNERWTATSEKLTEHLQRHAEAMEATAAEYRKVEDTNTDRSDQFFQGIG